MFHDNCKDNQNITTTPSKIGFLSHVFRIVLRVIFFNTTNIQLYRNTYSKTIFVQNAHLHCLGTNSNKVNYYFTRINFTISPLFFYFNRKAERFPIALYTPKRHFFVAYMKTVHLENKKAGCLSIFLPEFPTF